MVHVDGYISTTPLLHLRRFVTVIATTTERTVINFATFPEPVNASQLSPCNRVLDANSRSPSRVMSGIASTVILGAVSRGTHHYIHLSHGYEIRQTPCSASREKFPSFYRN